MSSLPKPLIFVAVLSILAAVVIKLLGIPLSGADAPYPFQPRSFLNFSNSLLLLSIALSVLKKE